MNRQQSRSRRPRRLRREDWREYFGSDGYDGAVVAGVAAADSILFYGDTGGRCAGARVYATDGRVHHANCAA